MPKIPEYGEYRTRLADAPEIRQNLQTDAAMFGGSQAKALGAWGEAFGGMGEDFGKMAGTFAAKQEKEKRRAEEQQTAETQPQPETPERGGQVWSGAALSRNRDEAPAEGDGLPDIDRSRYPMVDARPAPSAPEPPAPEHQAKVDAVFDRPAHTPQSLLEYRESQADLAEAVRGWRRAVGRGEMSAEDVRDLVADEIRGHTRGMRTEEAVRALTGWGERQVAAIAANEGSSENRLALAASRRLDQRRQDVIDAGGDLQVLTGQLSRATRDAWQDGATLGLPVERIGANVRRAQDTLSAAAVLAAADRQPLEGEKLLAVLRGKGFLSDAAAEPLLEIMIAHHRPGDPEGGPEPVPLADDTKPARLVPAAAGAAGSDDGPEAVAGGEGNDTLQGGSGNDVLNGEPAGQSAELSPQTVATPRPPLAGSGGTSPQPGPADERSVTQKTIDKINEVLRGVLGPAFEPLMQLPEWIGPGADVRDMVEGSGEVSKGVASLDPKRAAEGTAQMGGGLLGLFVPGNHSRYRTATDAVLNAADNAMKANRERQAEKEN